MLIEFKVTNFRSIREEQILRLVANNSDKSMPDNTIPLELPGLSGLQFLKGVALYGANASGKSNLIKALRFVRRLVTTSATRMKPGEEVPVEPFLLDKDSKNRASSFEVTFVAEGVRYQFGFSATKTRIVEEYLVAYPKGLPQRWYHRVFDDEGQVYIWREPSSFFKRDSAVQDKTRENALFISVGPQFNHDQLTIVYQWFERNLRFLDLAGDKQFGHAYSASRIGNPDLHDPMMRIIRNADLGIVNVNEVREKLSGLELESLSDDEIERLAMSSPDKVPMKTRLEFLHQGDGSGLVSMGLDAQSAGTKRLFALAGPWSDILRSEHTVVIDEIETSLHPILVEELLRLLFSPEHCGGAAQVVFATHNPLLLSRNILRRDQIWFTEKTPAGTTRLYPLTDFRPRKEEALSKGYLAGRYGATPFIPHGLGK